MRKSAICLSTILLFSSTAFAGVCENAVRGAERKAATSKAKCENNTAIDRLKTRLATAKTEKSKAGVQKLIDKALAKQQAYCRATTANLAVVDKIKSFCSIAASASTSYCKFGYSLRVKGTEASSRCKRGRLWFAGNGTGDDANGKCYYVEEYYYTSADAFGNGKQTGRGEILYSGQAPGTNFYQINTGFYLDGVKKQADCK